MTQYAALLRGINVGGRIIKMDALKLCLTEAGFKNVKTILQSGNVLFDSSLSSEQSKRSMESALQSSFGYDAKVQVVSLKQLRRIVEHFPFGKPIEGSHDYVVFIEDQLENELTNESFDLTKNEFVEPSDGVVYWRVEKGSTLTTAFAKLLTKKKYKDFTTTRNLNTLHKLLVGLGDFLD